MDSSDSDEEIINFYDASEDEEDFDYNLDRKNNNPKIVYRYEALNIDELFFDMKQEITKISNILIVSQPIAKCLLNHYKWNKDELLNDCFNYQDMNAFFNSVGINIQLPMVSGALKDCGICFTPFSQTNEKIFMCGHQFCVNCCVRYFQVKILSDGEGNYIKCPDSDCKMWIDDETIMEVIPKNVQDRLKALSTTSFVLSNPLYSWCRQPNCEYAIKVEKVEPLPVICKCGFESCFACGELWHESVTCALLKKWIQFSADDAESYKWIQENAKKCPKCMVNIEKNGGCNHMKCRSCQHEFCWLCMNDWRGHGSCNIYQQSKEDVSRRLEHYNIRYNNHIQSLQLEQGLYNSIETRMKNLQGMASLTNNEVLFLKRAVDSLRQSRQILISTYVFAYYSEKSNQLLIFEDNQRDLELATENLSWFLEEDITNETVVQIKQKLQEKYTYCDSRRRVLLDHINEGYKKGYWKLKD